ncbi:MAG: DUF5687 family protein [Dysgonamonadaceae bacterium]|jgi:hypothetical protein|nr:DUF5687 family protein [Dysgonamonadaceae bacterium]
MLQKELRQHQWKAFRRNPMFERNFGVRIFMFVMFGYLALEFLVFGFVLDKMLLEIGTYERAIDIFNSLLPYILAVDFTIKFFFKQNQSMQIAPYLSLPVGRNRLFHFLLRKEFSSFWNLYFLFLVVPFAFKAITPFFGFGTAVLYILFFYLLCIISSLAVNLLNNFIKRSILFYALAAVIIISPFALVLLLHIDTGDYTQRFSEWILNYNPLAWLAVIGTFAGLWFFNRTRMRKAVYDELQGDKSKKISSFSSISFLDRFGVIGDFINLEVRMILRSPRLKQQVLFACPLIVGLFLFMIYNPNSAFQASGQFVYFLYGVFSIGLIGLIMGQYLFTSESSFFDGLMSRKISLYEMLKSKFILYCSVSLFITLILFIPAFQGKISFFMVIALFFYTVGPVYFMIFQNVVYNKTYFDLFDKGMMNWKGTSGNMIVITMIGMFLPVILMLIINALWGETVLCWFMLSTGIALTLTVKYWLEWTYKRFLKRKYKNMEGFRSNA